MSHNRENRKREMEAAYQAGRDAYHAGKGLGSEPVHSVDRGRWRDGWYEASAEAHNALHDTVNNRMQSLFDDVPCDATRAALEAIWEKVNG